MSDHAYRVMQEALEEEKIIRLLETEIEVARLLRFKFYTFRKKLTRNKDKNAEAFNKLIFSIKRSTKGIELSIKKGGGQLEDILQQHLYEVDAEVEHEADTVDSFHTEEELLALADEAEKTLGDS